MRRRRRRRGDEDVRGLERIEHTIERPRIADRFERPQCGDAHTGRSIGFEEQDEPIDGPRANQRQSRDRCLAHVRARGTEIGYERFDLSGRGRLDRHGGIRTGTGG